jgi:protein-tyrosine-phosphatase
MKTVLFVCLGNISRSVIAEHLLRKILIEQNLSEVIRVQSCGLKGSAGTTPTKFPNLSGYVSEYAAARSVLERYEIDISEHVATPINLQAMRAADVVIAMDTSVLSEAPNSLTKQFPEERSKTRLFTGLSGEQSDIVDPCGNTDENRYVKIIGEIDHVLRSHIDTLLAWINHT